MELRLSSSNPPIRWMNLFSKIVRSDMFTVPRWKVFVVFPGCVVQHSAPHPWRFAYRQTQTSLELGRFLPDWYPEMNISCVIWWLFSWHASVNWLGHCWLRKLLVAFWAPRNRPVLQMQVPLVACHELVLDYYTFPKLLWTCHELVLDYYTFPKLLYVFEHKTSYFLICAPYTRIVVFWHISNTHPPPTPTPTRNLWGDIYNFAVKAVSADGLVPLGARKSARTVWAWYLTGLTLFKF